MNVLLKMKALKWIQEGTFDTQFGEYEWSYKDNMGVRRRKFYL